MPELGTLDRGIRAALAEAPRRYRVLVEPGRFLSAPAMTLATRVIGTTRRDDGAWAYLDDGVYGAFSNIPSEATHPLVFAASELDMGRASDLEPGRDRAERRVRARAHEPVTLAGPTCDSLDVIAVHLVGGILGAVLLGFFADTKENSLGFDGVFFGGGADLLVDHLVALGATIAFSFVVTWIIAKAIDATIGLRVSSEDELVGLDHDRRSRIECGLVVKEGHPGLRPGAVRGQPAGLRGAPRWSRAR